MDDEFAKIDWLAERLGRDRSDASTKHVVLGIGDDAAIVDFLARPAVITVDTQVEGVHFRRSMLSSTELGARAIIAAASDVWAMGTTPTAAVVAITLPPDYADSGFHELIEGLDDGCRELGASVVGGNLSSAGMLSITTTVLGPAPDRVLTRAGAQVGDAIYVTGTLGSAALGFAALDRAETIPGGDAFISRWRRPPSHGVALPTIASVATAAIDVSDGFLQDLSHLCRASGVGAEVQAERLPTASDYKQACATLRLDPHQLSLTGGEDYEVLFTAPEGSIADGVASAVGRVTRSPGVSVLDANGTPLPSSGGYRHFS